MKRGSARALLLAVAALAGAAISAAETKAKPRIAVVIDDFGLTYPKNVPDEAWMKIPWPATYAVMPRSPRTRRSAEETLKAGKELIIHFPFDPFLSLQLPKGEAHSPQDAALVAALLKDSLASIPGAVGINNHRSYRATQNRALMRWFMGEFKPKGLYFLDSRVSPGTVAYEEALRAQVPAMINDIYLDEARRHDKAFCLRMLKAAAAKARKNGHAVAIGHHYFHGTYEGLVEGVPKLQAEGFDFVFLSQLLSSR